MDIDSLADGDSAGALDAADDGAAAELGADEAPGAAVAPPPPQAASASGKAMAAVSAANFAARDLVANMDVAPSRMDGSG